jgi:hypothetical protein
MKNPEKPNKVIGLMNCEEFEIRGADLDRRDTDPFEAEAAAEHARLCANCNALLESWRQLKSDLRLLREATRSDSAPARVEMRLKQELRTRREARLPLGTLATSAWALAVAAVLIAAVSWIGWQRTRHQGPSAQNIAVPGTPIQNLERPETTTSESSAGQRSQVEASERSGAGHSGSAKHALAKEVPVKDASAEDLPVKDDSSGKFTLLPGSLPFETDETAIVRVRMQRGALGTLGLPVNEERADEWIQVDLLVGNDGLPQAVRLAR